MGNWIPVIITGLILVGICVLAIREWLKERDRRIASQAVALERKADAAEAQAVADAKVSEDIRKPGTKGELERLLEAAEAEMQKRGIK